ncbi:MAG TPA: winged helix-turn-helix domain-containing protein [Blastocatellia bacterium]|nr:winged helix-turn-helix domain-containing protein [Blastocatellia bacterium]
MENKPFIYQFDDVRVEPHTLKLFKNGNVVRIEPKTFKVLLFLLENRNRVVEKKELLDAIWNDAFVTENALTRVIAQLRKAIGDDAKGSKYIETVPTLGYRFSADIIATELNGSTAQITDNPIGVVTNGNDIGRASTLDRSDISADVPRVRRSVNPETLVAVAAAVVVILATIGMWEYFRKPALNREIAVAKTTQITSSAGLDIYPGFSPDGNFVAYSSDRTGSFEIYVKPLTPGGREIQLTSDAQQNMEPAWSPDGKQIAYRSKDRGIWIMPALGGTAKQIINFGAHPAWSPDGTTIAFQSIDEHDLGATASGASPSSEIWTVNLQTQQSKRITDPAVGRDWNGSPSWSPDGKHIVFCSYAQLWSIKPNGDDPKRLASHQIIHSLTYSPKGDGVFYIASDIDHGFGLWKILLDPITGDALGPPQKIATTTTASKGLAISADEKRIACSEVRTTSNLASLSISPNTGEAVGPPTLLTHDTSLRKFSPMFSPDGKKILFEVWSVGSNSNIWVIDADGTNSRQVTADASDHNPNWFPDGEEIFFVSRRNGKDCFFASSLTGAQESLLLTLELPFAVYEHLSPDGKRVAFQSRDDKGAINVWLSSLDSGQTTQITFDKEVVGWPYWSPDGNQLVVEAVRGEDSVLYTTPSDGGPLTPLVSDRGQSWSGGWSPDGKKIAFAGQRDGVWNLWWVSPITKEKKRLTNYDLLREYVRYPDWSPRGDQIVYEYAETTGNIWIMDLK